MNLSRNRKPEVLINYSGGIDSVYCAWKYLREGDRVLLHHCSLKTRFGRHPYEKRAVLKTLEYFKKVGLKNFAYIETGFEYGDIKNMIYDVEIIGFLTGVILRSRPYSQINRVAVSVNSDDPTGKDINTFRRRRSNLYAEAVRGKRITWEYPMIEMTKEQMILEMPRELLLSCWWCRTPAPNGKPCNLCRSCKEVNQIMKGLTN